MLLISSSSLFPPPPSPIYQAILMLIDAGGDPSRPDAFGRNTIFLSALNCLPIAIPALEARGRGGGERGGGGGERKGGWDVASLIKANHNNNQTLIHR